MEQAIRKMTSLPAAIVDLPGRGQIKEGYYADLVIFAPNAVRSTATWEKPAQAPVGVEHVVVNGCVQVEASRMTANACGRLLRKEPANATTESGFAPLAVGWRSWPMESAAGRPRRQDRILTCSQREPAAASAAFCRRPAANEVSRFRIR